MYTTESKHFEGLKTHEGILIMGFSLIVSAGFFLAQHWPF